jgi:hypothetical protein
MQINRHDIIAAAEGISLYDEEYTIRDDYKGWNLTPCAGVTLPPARLTEFMVSLALVLAEDGRAEEARELAEKTSTETLGIRFAVYWPGVELAS